MKLENIHIGVSPLTDRIYLGTLRNSTTWSSKVDCTITFIAALMDWSPPGVIRTVTDNHGNTYEVQVKKVVAVSVKETP